MPAKANCRRIKKAQFPGAGLTAAWLLIMETSKIIGPVVPRSLSARSAQQKMQPSEASTCPVLKEMSAVTDGKMPPNSECLFQWGCVFLIICCPYLKRFVPALYKCTSGCSLKIPSRAVSHRRHLIRWKRLWKGAPCFTSTQGRSSSRTCTDLVSWLSAWGQPLSDQVLLVAPLSPWHSLSPGNSGSCTYLMPVNQSVTPKTKGFHFALHSLRSPVPRQTAAHTCCIRAAAKPAVFLIAE
ncbi:uncharacterized protein LOC116441625 isoform X1 [Corvus moneduloides]|uniref:uncharacterized protein LOC116441625 isoform X1 n=1 Tax=Corvus moneduloides TaxID=1196302 RepID=UPI0013637E7B|nr:uncharacterized protein LOC116441625 isoform X1 [Corvus moneduloides]